MRVWSCFEKSKVVARTQLDLYSQNKSFRRILTTLWIILDLIPSSLFSSRYISFIFRSTPLISDWYVWLTKLSLRSGWVWSTPSSRILMTTPLPVIPCRQTGITSRSTPAGPVDCPWFNYIQKNVQSTIQIFHFYGGLLIVVVTKNLWI